MTVQELIVELNKIENKEREIAVCILSTVVGLDGKESDDGPVLIYTE